MLLVWCDHHMIVIGSNLEAWGNQSWTLSLTYTLSNWNILGGIKTLTRKTFQDRNIGLLDFLETITIIIIIIPT